MSDAITDSAGLSGPVEEKPAPRKRTTKSATTKKVAEQTPEIINASIEEAVLEDVNEEGQKIITGPAKKKTTRSSNMHVKEEGAISSHAADRALANKFDTEESKKEEKDNKVAIWSAKNVRWTGVGSLSKGYNIVKKEAAEKWLVREGIREATPEEVATHYGK